MQDLKEKNTEARNAEVLENTKLTDERLDISDRPKRSCLGRYVIKCIFLALFFVLGTALISLSIWYKDTYGIPIKELLYVITGPLEGTGAGTINAIILATAPAAAIALAIFTVGAILVRIKKHRIMKRILTGICAAVFPFSVIVTAYSFEFSSLLNATKTTYIYEEYYVFPNDVNITPAEEKRNLIYIYVESLETTHMTLENGGVMTEDYLPNLTELAKENISFSNKNDGLLGGFLQTSGTWWTIAALLSSTSGIPFSFPIERNYMHEREEFAPGLTNLGDILEANGYNQEFLCGSEAVFAGRDKYFAQHGNYKIFDLFTAREEGYISEDYHNGWWGYEDKYLFEIAKDEATRLYSEGKPFNLTILTVDTHPDEGYVCDECGDEFSEKTANVLSCSDRQVSEFVNWCKEQEFFDNTTIIITGDHARQDSSMVEDIPESERTMYNCFINSAVEPEGALTERVWTSLDMFPTTLAAMGFEIEGDRLGLGTNMFSGEQTLAERLGYDRLNEEIGKSSDFYLENFYYTQAELEAIKKEREAA